MQGNHKPLTFKGAPEAVAGAKKLVLEWLAAEKAKWCGGGGSGGGIERDGPAAVASTPTASLPYTGSATTATTKPTTTGGNRMSYASATSHHREGPSR